MRLPSRTASAAALLLALTACHPARLPPSAPGGAAASVAPADAALVALQNDLDTILAAPALGQSYWGVVAKSLATGDTLYALHANRLLMPASAMKIVTVAVAGEELGWNYTYETRLVAAGTIAGGVLSGDLVVIGSGDPSINGRGGLAARLFADWAEQIKAAGVRTIDGRIIGDGHAFDDEPLGFGWSWDDLAEGFAAPVGALQYNENTAQVTIRPGARTGASATADLAPAGSGLLVDSRARTTAAGSRAAVTIRRLPGSAQLLVRGSVPLDSAPLVRTVSVDHPARFFVAALRDALVAHGVAVHGPAVDADDLTEPPSTMGAVPLVSYRSPALSMLSATLMKESRNLYAETFLKTMGRPAAGDPGAATIEAGRARVDAALERWGVPTSELVQRDGSGLSRYDYVTADALVGILSHVAREETLRDPFNAALAIAGRDGTLAERMKGTPAEGNVRAKTGSMTNVRALAGYVTTADGEPVVFAIIANNFEARADQVTGAIDAMAVRLASFSRTARSTSRKNVTPGYPHRASSSGSAAPASANPRARSTQLSHRPQGRPAGSGS